VINICDSWHQTIRELKGREPNIFIGLKALSSAFSLVQKCRQMNALGKLHDYISKDFQV
jgi:hypothetical protein